MASLGLWAVDPANDREIDHVVETLIGISINGTAYNVEDMVNNVLEINTPFIEAPTVTFTVQSSIYYVGETEPEISSKDVEGMVSEQAGRWYAPIYLQTADDKMTYYVSAFKPQTAVITYMDGATVLGTETVAKGDPSTKYTNYQVMPLATFEGWYLDAALNNPVDVAIYSVGADITLYGKFVKTYIQSLNIEQFVLDNGTKSNIKSALTDAGWDYAHLNNLDSLNDIELKDNRNYAFLGLILDSADAYIQGRIQTGGIIIKFGNLGNSIKATVKGATTDIKQTFPKETLWSDEDQAYELVLSGFTEEVFINISTVSSDTIVLKQLMLVVDGIQVINLPAPSAYLITIAESENGTVTADWADKKYRTLVNTTVTLTVTPAEGYEIKAIKINGDTLEAVEGVYSFTMPAEDVTVEATFAEATPLEPTTYTVTIAEGANGTVVIDGDENAFEADTTVTLTVTPNEGYEVDAIKINDNTLEAVEGVYSFKMPAEDVTVEATFAEATPLEPTTYTVTIAEVENGTIVLDGDENAFEAGATVTLTVTPADGYIFDAVTVNGEAIEAVEGIYSFTMPAEDVTVEATFSATGTGLYSVESAVKPVKTVENGQVIIIKNCVKYNAQGTMVH